MSKAMDTIGWYLATLHQLVGHDKARQIVNGIDGDPKFCILCQYEKGAASKADVIEAIGV